MNEEVKRLMVDAMAGYEMLSFLDAFSGYNKILMHPNDEEKTSFISKRGIYYCKMMSIKLKNAGTPFQRLSTKCSPRSLGKPWKFILMICV